MSKLLEISNEELELVIDSTSDSLNMAKAIIEKDLWVCMILNYLFSEFKYKDSIVFKGGTSLSKVYKLITSYTIRNRMLSRTNSSKSSNNYYLY
jgi:hypothetical protein